ncbi:hypothetical protein [Xenorhabdus sp. KJ12.1]|uniref:hypothetical protein n=1 Tax=Xenorhabdus sp. KJ12.1 TaxID=1851571 RepID=UPI000C03F1AE|nr:hypothetical protein [Xenorhabdus sp. KJ12.1]PHM69187.1 hypothetical protein Xekj_02703 [Xenorhabdus sp. KJ12.1]
MADFRQSFSTGVAAAQAAAANKKEINDLIMEVNKQLKETYDGKVHFGVWNLSKKLRKKGTVTNVFVDAFNLDVVEYQGLCITNSDNKEPIALVEWKISENGYPCIIKYDDRDAYCYNKEDLVTEFSTLLSDVKTGKAILKQLEIFSEKGQTT